ncbi:MAG: hypothetical protein U0401_08930 [Anaerolineae bacterium]
MNESFDFGRHFLFSPATQINLQTRFQFTKFSLISLAKMLLQLLYIICAIALGTEIIQLEAEVEPRLTEEEQKILDLKATGASYRAISTEVWGQVGQFYNQKIDAILAKHSEK